MRRLIAIFYRIFFGLRLDATRIQLGDLERMRDELILARNHIDGELLVIARQIDEAIEHRLQLAERIQGARS